MDLELIKRLLEIAATTDEYERVEMLDWLSDEDKSRFHELQKRKFFDLVVRFRDQPREARHKLKAVLSGDFRQLISALEDDGHFPPPPSKEAIEPEAEAAEESNSADEGVSEEPEEAESVKGNRKAGRKGYPEADKKRLAAHLNVPYVEGDQSLKDVWSLPKKLLKQDSQKFGEPVHAVSEDKPEVWRHTPWRIHAIFVYEADVEVLRNLDSVAERIERKTHTVVRWREYCLDTNESKINEEFKFYDENKAKGDLLVRQKVDEIKSIIAKLGNRKEREKFYERYLTIDHYLRSDLFKDVLTKSKDGVFKRVFPRRIGAVFALYYVFTGLKKDDGGKGTLLFNTLSYLLRKSRNIEVGANPLMELKEILTSYCFSLVGPDPVVTFKYWRNSGRLLRDALENAKTRLDREGDQAFGNLLNEFDVATKFVLNEYDSLLKASENHKPLSISNVKALLDRAAESATRYVYFRILLQLSTGLRTIEMERFGIKYLSGKQGSRYLIYKEAPAGLPLLVSKTVKSKKVNINSLSNPKTDTVTNIILRHYWKHFDPTIKRVGKELATYESEMKKEKVILKNFWSKSSRDEWASGSVRRSEEDEDFDFTAGEADAEIYERRLRATCATMLCYAIESKVCPGNVAHRDAQERLGHIDGSMVASVYAKRRPPDAEKAKSGVDQYFGTAVVSIPNPNYVDGGDEPKELELNRFESAWSLFLLLEFYQRMTEQGDTKIGSYIAEEYVKRAEYVPDRVHLRDVKLKK